MCVDESGADYSLLEAEEARSEVLDEVIAELMAAHSTSDPQTDFGLDRAIEIVEAMKLKGGE